MFWILRAEIWSYFTDVYSANSLINVLDICTPKKKKKKNRIFKESYTFPENQLEVFWTHEKCWNFFEMYFSFKKNNNNILN